MAVCKCNVQYSENVQNMWNVEKSNHYTLLFTFILYIYLLVLLTFRRRDRSRSRERSRRERDRRRSRSNSFRWAINREGRGNDSIWGCFFYA